MKTKQWGEEHPNTYKFRRMYANMPIPLRSSDILVIIDDEPMTAQVIRLEVDHNTKIGYKAIDQLTRLKILRV